jgi:outer membrane protein assembly factor BamB
VQNLFRLCIEADEAGQNQRLTFVDDGGSERESSLAVLVDWHDGELRSTLEPVFDEFIRDYRESSHIVSPGSFLERLVHALDAALGDLEAERLDAIGFGVALCCGRGLYLLHSRSFEVGCTLDGVAQPLVSSLRVRVKDLSPSTMRGSHLWSEALVERLTLVRVFFEDEDRAGVWMAPVTGGDAEAAAVARIVVDKEPAGELVGAGRGPLDSTWPDLEDFARRDRKTLSYVAVGLVVLLFGTAVFGMWRWHHMSSASTPTGAEALFSEAPDASVDARHQSARVSADVADNEDGSRKSKDASLQHGDAEPGELAILWSKRHTDWVTSSPRLAHGRVVYGCRDGNLYALDPDGQVSWEYDSGAGIGATPAVDDGRVFCGNYSGRAFAVRDKDGKEQWSVDLGAKLIASPAAGKKHVFFATQAGEIVALQKKDGKVAWRHEAGGKLRATPLAAGDDLYAPGGDGELICFKQGSGDVRWTYDAGSAVQSCPLLADGRLVFGCKDGSVHAVAVKDGASLWSLRTKGAVQGTPAFEDGLVYVTSSDKRLYAVRLKTGDVAWTFPTKAALLASPSVQDGRVYITAYDQHTYVLDAESGRELGRLRLKAPIYSSPLVAEGRIYCGSNDGTVYCMSDVAHR